MPDPVADDFDAIARRLRELEAEKTGGAKPAPESTLTFQDFERSLKKGAIQWPPPWASSYTARPGG